MKKFITIGILLGLLGCADLSEEMRSSNDSLGLSGPKGDKGNLEAPLIREWKLEGYENGKVNKSTVLEFKTQRNLAGNSILSGISAVNFYEAGYVLNGNNGIKIVSLSMTEIGGPAQEMDFERKYFERLASMNSYSFKDKTLVLKNAKGEEMYFK